MISGIWQRPALIERNNFVFKSLSCWSYNIAVGCGHACRFCVSGDARIQMADGLTKAMQDVVIGEKIIGVKADENGRFAKFIQGTIVAKIKTERLAFRMRTANAEIICSDDHRWLTRRGWKFTTGPEQGYDRRPHLTEGSRILTVDSHLAPFAFNEDYKSGYLAGLIRGDGVLARYDYSGSRPWQQMKDVQHHFRLFMKDPEPIDRAEKWLADLGVPVRRFLFKYKDFGPYPGIRSNRRDAYESIRKFIEERKNSDWSRGWLAGFFDAEGNNSTRMTNVTESNLATTERALAMLGFDYTRDRSRTRRAENVRFRGGLKERLRFFQTVAPAIGRKLLLCGQSPRQATPVIDVKPLGTFVEMFDITTTCETFIANGLVAHNCYVPSASTNKMGAKLAEHGVRDPDAEWGDYVLLRQWNEQAFKVSLKCAESKPLADLNADGNRAVMFCTTTDPYQVIRRGLGSAGQPVEGVDLTVLNQQCATLVREALRLIRDHSTLNVRILTRSPLASDDFDLMKSFGPRLLFGMSIPTLNNRLATIYEPKAPAPSRRLETLKEAKEAGLHIYVAVAPVYPECDGDDMAATCQALAELDPVTVFMEPINIRAENVKRIADHAAKIGQQVNTAVFESTKTWAGYALWQLFKFEEIARGAGLGSKLHLWPDKNLRAWIDPKRLEVWWNKISAWPK